MKKKYYIMIFIIAVILLFLLILFIFKDNYKNKLPDIPGINTDYSSDSSDTDKEYYYDTELDTEVELKDNPINFKKLKKQNEDLYAWIYIPNTNINYAVAQHPYDNSFYLSHDNDKNYLFDGSIYTERYNKKDFSDPNTVLYGHNMLDGSMFATLHNFQDKEFFDENRYFYIYTEGHILTYEIFAAYEYDNRHLLNTIDFYDKKVFADYLESIKTPRSFIHNIRNDVKVTADDKIVTLSTCIGNKENSRYLVQGVLIKNENTK